MSFAAAREERGSGTVLALGIITVLMILLALISLLGAAAVAKTQAVRAADLAALAAADTARGLSSGDPCTVAERVVARNGAVLAECVVGGEFPTEVTVSVTRGFDPPVLSAVLPLRNLPATGASRAGPPEGLPSSEAPDQKPSASGSILTTTGTTPTRMNAGRKQAPRGSIIFTPSFSAAASAACRSSARALPAAA